MSDAQDRPKGKSLKPLRALAPFLRPYRGTLTLAMTALVIASGATLVLPLVGRKLIDFGFLANDPTLIDRYFGWLLVAGAVLACFGAVRFYLVTWLGERVVADIRDALYRRVIRMDATFFEITRTGEVLSRLTTDTTLIQSISGVNISIAVRSTLNLIGALVLLILTSPKLAGWILLLIVVVLLPLIVVGRRVRRLSRTAQDRIADSSGLAGETLNAIQTVQAFTLENLQIERFSQAVQASFRTAVRRTRIRAILIGIGMMMVFGAIGFVVWLGTHSVREGTMTVGQLSQFIIYSMVVATAAPALSEMWGEVQRASGAMERLVELLNSEPSIVAPANPATLPQPVAGRIHFDHVSFRYPSRPDSWALQDFDLRVAPGETVAFVGPSGAGKSTTFQMLLRFYDPQLGRLTLDDIDIATLRPEDLRRQVGLVPQETMLFGTSARENIRYGRPDASDAEVEAAARAAAAHDFIMALPEGYETFLGERGTRLSGGQRQRVAIARAILKNPPVLLLDEATSALDAESERLVQQALEELMRERTTIVIAHRLATVLRADRIVLMNQGQILDIGTHSELVAREPLYAQLAKLQFENHALPANELSQASSGRAQ
jgi:ATP-binding cassette subfamily B protein